MSIFTRLRTLLTRSPVAPSAPVAPWIHHRNELPRDLEDALVREARNRKQNPDWIESERQLLWTIVNNYRAQFGKQPVSLEEVKKVEDQAVGHIDYTHKFALYCSELAEK